MSLAQRSVRSSTYTIGASVLQTAVQLVRLVLLARILPREVFGVYTFASSITLMTHTLPIFGMTSALLHRAPESEGETALRVQFTLSLIFNAIWAIGIVAVSLFLPPDRRWVLLVLLLTQIADNLVQTNKTVLIKRVVFRRIALIDTINIVIGSIAAVALALNGAGVWSLVATDIVAASVSIAGYLLIKPPWQPKLGWSKDVVLYLLGFGKRTFIAGFVGQVLDYIDNLWTGIFLGDDQLGLYSRAYTFSTYPRKILATPLNSVTSGTYAELKGQSKKLSQSFFRVNAFLIRSGFFMSGMLVLIAPEFITIFLGTKWLPMLTAFRLLLLFAMLDPIKMTVSGLFIAIGVPEIVARVRLIQLGIMVVGLFVFGFLWDITGVAIAVNLMAITGVVLLLVQARKHVQFSVWKLFSIPVIALALSLLSAQFAVMLPWAPDSPLITGAVKIVIFTIVYGVILFLFERKNFKMVIEMAALALPERMKSRK
jgi:PST family polysaccharide transporter